MSVPAIPPQGVLARARAFGRMVRLSHTIFGMPFALAAALLAHDYGVAHAGQGLELRRIVLIVVAFTGARTAAMGFNRLVDRRFDALNPRTEDREIPRGEIGVGTAWAFTLGAAAVFVGAAIGLGPVTAVLAVPCLGLIGAYSFFKRFSWTSHLALGLALALAPGGAWVAVTGGFSGWPIPVALMVAVATWVAGFDILYSLSDREFDRTHNLHSIPVRFGVRGALAGSAVLHGVTVVALLALHLVAGLGWAHAVGVAAIVVILAYEHAIVRPGDLSRIDRAFFDLNGYISLAYLAATLVEVLA